MERLVCVIIGYVCGLLQTGYLYGKWKHIDIRQHGSGNAGTTNTLRTLGWKAGMITFLGDFLKCVVAVWIVHILYSQAYPEELALLSMYAGMGAVLGHNYPFYLKFKGGKGIAATAGLIFATNPMMMLIAAIVFLGNRRNYQICFSGISYNCCAVCCGGCCIWTARRIWTFSGTSV